MQSIKRQAGADFPVSLRYSVVSKTKAWGKGAMPYETDFEEFGRDMAESEKAVKYLGDAGYDMFNCDNGTYDAWYWAHPPQYMPDNCNLEYVEHIKNFTDKPVACAGRMDPVKAAEEIAAGRLDAVAIARQNLVDPDWVTKIRQGRQDEIKPCIRCHNGCFNFAKFKGTANIQSTQDSLHLGRCALNPTTMQHNKYKIVPTKSPKKVAIIGAGIGGMECALVLKQRGHKPVIFEKTNELGGLFLTASAMSFKENDKELIEWYKKEVEKQGIDIRFNTEVTDLGTMRGFDEIIVATAWANSGTSLTRVMGPCTTGNSVPCDSANGLPGRTADRWRAASTDFRRSRRNMRSACPGCAADGTGGSTGAGSFGSFHPAGAAACPATDGFSGSSSTSPMNCALAICLSMAAGNGSGWV